MNTFYKSTFLVLLTVLIVSCAEQDPLEFEVEKPASIANQELIDAYADLKSYVDTINYPQFSLGVQATLANYTGGGVFQRLVHANFQEVTFSNGMQHGDIVQDNGNQAYDDLNTALTTASDKGLSVFGNSLVWHKNQNANYLNSLIEPVTINIPPVFNYVDKSGLYDTSLADYTVSGPGATATIVEGEGFNEAQAILLTAGTGASQATDLQLTTPDINLEAGVEYRVIFHIRSDVEGQGRVSFEGLNENEPLLDYDGDGEATETFTTNRFWKEISFTLSEQPTGPIKINFDLGFQPNVNYYIDVTTLYVYDLSDDGSSGQGTSIPPLASDDVWLEAECGNVGANWVFVEDPTASEGTYTMIQKPTPATTVPASSPEGLISFDFKVKSNGNFKLFARVGAEVLNGADDSFYFRIDNNPWVTFNGVINETNLKWYQITAADLDPAVDHTVTVSYREDGAKFDKLYITNGFNTPTDVGGVAANCGGVVIVNEKSDEEKDFIISNALENWISGMVTNSVDYVHAWNVINEPMDDINPSELKSGATLAPQPGVFYWQDYLGENYAVDAFNLARSNAKSGDLLFISDYDLERNLDKCRGLIEYVNYIESEGAQVDGIAAKMNLTVFSDRDQIQQMFELLAATGKMVAVTELSVDLMTSQERSQALLEEQAAMYRYVVETYAAVIPANQRYGISIEDAVDNDNENVGLWDARTIQSRKYTRKPAYKGLADGLEQL